MTHRFSLRLALLALTAVFTLPFAQRAGADETPASASERVPILWEVQNEPKIYLFGTIHVADPRVTSHPPAVQRALDESQALYTELDFSKLGPELQQHIMLPDGKSLGDYASDEVVEALDRVLTRYEIPAIQAAQFKRFRPWLTSVQVPILVNTKRKADEAAAAAAENDEPAPSAPANPMASLPLDLQLYMGAMQQGKTVGGLEFAEEQFAIFNEITYEKQVEMLAESLAALEKLDEPQDENAAEVVDPIEALIRTYIAGEADRFYDMMKEQMGGNAEMTAFMEQLLDRRNETMVRRMIEAGNKHPDKTMFVAVGAAHYPGPVGVVKLLQDTGFRVRRIRSLADMDAPWPPLRTAPAASSRAAPGRIRIGPFCFPRPGCCPK
ncbi:MAG: TraB/GumN family protein [Planctomycetota bacterium]|nr:TraB/GumN family protein [Planctomycetota bacterium]